jgi:TPR repeat protein
VRSLTRLLSVVALVILMAVAGVDIANACPVVTDKNGNYSPAEHVRCLHEAAEQGDMVSQHLLGSVYFIGDEAPQDYEEAAKWFSRAANQGDSTAQFYLASMYFSGEGVTEDIVCSQMWLILSTAQGNEYARLARDRAEQQMTPAQIKEAQKLAREWKPKPEP